MTRVVFQGKGVRVEHGARTSIVGRDAGTCESVALSLDILVNNAGGMYDAPIDQFTEAGWDSIADLNLKSVFFLMQQLLAPLRAAR
jgi:NAD(P)-dependent dehydrogenase (short-subunit alcohol dehydrogenase family)